MIYDLVIAGIDVATHVIELNIEPSPHDFLTYVDNMGIIDQEIVVSKAKVIHSLFVYQIGYLIDELHCIPTA